MVEVASNGRSTAYLGGQEGQAPTDGVIDFRQEIEVQPKIMS